MASLGCFWSPFAYLLLIIIIIVYIYIYIYTYYLLLTFRDLLIGELPPERLRAVREVWDSTVSIFSHLLIDIVIIVSIFSHFDNIIVSIVYYS